MTRVLAGLGLAAVVMLAGACSETSDKTGTSASSSSASNEQSEGTVHRYTTRGVVRELPDPDQPMNTFRVHHEAIEDFVKDGEVVGMKSMTMPFQPIEDVSLSGLKVGDKIRLTFEMRTGADVGFYATYVEKLPDDTVLNFEQLAGEE